MTKRERLLVDLVLWLAQKTGSMDYVDHARRRIIAIFGEEKE